MSACIRVRDSPDQMESLFNKGRDTGSDWVLLMLAGALWCISHPYPGLTEHDARIYWLLVLHWLSPDAYARDPFFLFGAQDRFSIFTPLHGVLAQLLGLPNAALAIAAMGGVLWVAAASVVARSLLDDRRLQIFAVLCCVIWSLNYSPNGATFLLNEAFPTARSIAFPVGALALGLAMRNQFRMAVVLAFMAFAVHPLLGLWPLLIILAQRMSDRTVIFVGLAITLLFIGLHFMGLGALQKMDPAWESIVRNSTFDVFIGPPGVARINETLAWLSLLLWGAHLGADGVRRWYRLGALIGAAGFFLAQLASYIYPVVLVVQAQLWRAMWVAVFLGVFAIAQIMGTAWGGRYRIWWAIGGLLLVIAGDWLGYILFASWVLFQTPLRVRAAVIGQRIEARAGRFAWLLLAGLLVSVLPGYVLDLAILGNSLAQNVQSGFPLLDGVLLAGGLGVGALLWAWLLTSGLPTRMLLAGSAALLVFAVLHWDQRLEKHRLWENLPAASRSPMFAGAIRPGEVVLWPGQMPQRVWHDLGTANYGSSDQAIGSVLSREKAFEMLRRRQRLAIASLAGSWPLTTAEASLLLDRFRTATGARLDETGNLLHSYKLPINLTGPGMLYACEDAALDWVISDRPLPQNVLRPVSGVGRQDVWLYSCGALRAAMPVPPFLQPQAAGNLEMGEG